MPLPQRSITLLVVLLGVIRIALSVHMGMKRKKEQKQTGLPDGLYINRKGEICRRSYVGDMSANEEQNGK